MEEEDLDDLSRIAIQYGTDKSPAGTYHAYTVRYHQLMEPIRPYVRSVLEIGIATGASLKMWRDYFPVAQVYGVDVIDCAATVAGERRITALCGDVTQPEVMGRLLEHGPFDIVVDDGSHALGDMTFALQRLYPATNWLYIVEDVHLGWYDGDMSRIVRETTNIEPEKLISHTASDRAAFIIKKRCP